MGNVTCTCDGFVGFGGQPVLLTSGDEYDSGHPFVAARPELFTQPEPEPQRAVPSRKAREVDA